MILADPEEDGDDESSLTEFAERAARPVILPRAANVLPWPHHDVRARMLRDIPCELLSESPDFVNCRRFCIVNPHRSARCCGYPIALELRL